jgi:hypothetical protein
VRPLELDLFTDTEDSDFVLFGVKVDETSIKDREDRKDRSLAIDVGGSFVSVSRVLDVGTSGDRGNSDV